MIKLYVAGPYNSNDVMGVALNMHHGIKVSTEMRRHGFAVYCPWDDFLEALFAPDIPIDHWRESSLEHLRSSQVMLIVDILPNWNKSVGTMGEISEAIDLKLPFFYYSAVANLLRWRDMYEGRT